MKPHRGTLILIFGILSLVTCPLFGIFAWVMGGRDLREMDQGVMDATGRGQTTAGRICGIIGTILMALWLVVVLFVFAGGLFFSLKEGVKTTSPSARTSPVLDQKWETHPKISPSPQPGEEPKEIRR